MFTKKSTRGQACCFRKNLVRERYEQGDAVYLALNNAPVKPIFNNNGSFFNPQTEGRIALTLAKMNYDRSHIQLYNVAGTRMK